MGTLARVSLNAIEPVDHATDCSFGWSILVEYLHVATETLVNLSRQFSSNASPPTINRLTLLCRLSLSLMSVK